MLAGFESKIINLFDDVIFGTIAPMIVEHVDVALEKEANEFLHDKGSHYFVDGFGFDFS